MDPAFLTIAELNRLYDQRELSPVEVTRALLDRIAAHDGKLHSFIRATPELALSEAAAAEREEAEGGEEVFHPGPMERRCGKRLSAKSTAARCLRSECRGQINLLSTDSPRFSKPLLIRPPHRSPSPAVQACIA